jgi:hypothetical protein
MRTMPLLFALACTPTVERPVDQAGPPTLAVSDLSPGNLATLTAFDMRPGEDVGFLLSTRGVGAGPCLPVLGGECLTIRGPVDLLGLVTADAAGVATLEMTVPATVPVGFVASFQAAQLPSAGAGAVLSTAASVRVVDAPPVTTTSPFSTSNFLTMAIVPRTGFTEVTATRDLASDVGIPTSAFASITGTVTDLDGLPVAGATVSGSGSSVSLTFPPGGQDFRDTNPATFEVSLEVTDLVGNTYTADALWTIGAVPEQSALMWNGSQGYAYVVDDLAPRTGASVYFGFSDFYGPDTEVAPGLWELGAGGPPVVPNLNLFYFSAGDRYTTSFNEAYFNDFALASSTPDVDVYDAEGPVDAMGQVRFVTPADYDGDGDIDAFDLADFIDNPPSTPFSTSRVSSSMAIAPDEAAPGSATHLLNAADSGPFDGADVAAITGVVRTYTGTFGSYSAGAAVPGATVTDDGGGDYEVALPGAALDFRTTNPITFQVDVDVTLADGSVYSSEYLWTIGAFPSVSAMMWIGTDGYIASGAAVAPRSGNSAYFGFSTLYGPDVELSPGLWSLNGPASVPTPSALSLLYFSNGNRYATSYNEALLSSPSVASTTSAATILTGNALSPRVPVAVHVVTADDYDGNSLIEPADLRAYLDAL